MWKRKLPRNLGIGAATGPSMRGSTISRGRLRAQPRGHVLRKLLRDRLERTTHDDADQRHDRRIAELAPHGSSWLANIA